MAAEVLAKPFHLFASEPRTPYGSRALGNFHLFGHKYIEVPNEPDALVINPGSYRITVEVGGERQSTIGRIRERIW